MLRVILSKKKEDTTLDNNNTYYKKKKITSVLAECSEGHSATRLIPDGISDITA